MPRAAHHRGFVMLIVLQTAIDAISLGSIYALTALGIGLIFGILRLINFAHGDFVTIGAYALIVPSAAVVATPSIGAWPAYFMIPAVIAVVIVVALATERVAFRPLRGASMASLLVGSFAVSYVLQHVILLVYSGRPKAVDVGMKLAESVNVAGLRVPAIELVAIAAALVLLAVLALFLRKTSFGIEMRAASEDFQMARLLGVRANVVIALAFAISGLLAAVVSLLLITQSGVLSVQMGLGVVMVAFVATVIGGMGSLLGAVVGGFVVGCASGVLQVLLPDSMKQMREVFVFAVVILILLVRPQGIVVARAAQERI
jgi:branched-chain amino acid transport system permease protein